MIIVSMSFLNNAIKEGNVANLRSLLSINVNEIDASGDHPLLIAVQTGNDEIVKLLLDNGSTLPTVPDLTKDPYIQACINGNYGAVTLFFKENDPRNHIYFYHLIRHKHYDLANRFITLGYKY